MKERVSALVGEQANDMWVLTFHSMCVRILRRDCERIRSCKVVYDYRFWGSTIRYETHYAKLNIDSDKFDARGILASISNAKIILKMRKPSQRHMQTSWTK